MTLREAAEDALLGAIASDGALGGGVTKQELIDHVLDENEVDCSRTTVRDALRNLREQCEIVSTPEGYVRVHQEDPTTCVCCGQDLEETEYRQALDRTVYIRRCVNSRCVRPYQQVLCPGQEDKLGCGTVYPIRPYPTPPGLGGKNHMGDHEDLWLEPPFNDREIYSWEVRAKLPTEYVGPPDESWSCPGCGAVWEPPQLWPFEDESLVPTLSVACMTRDWSHWTPGFEVLSRLAGVDGQSPE